MGGMKRTSSLPALGDARAQPGQTGRPPLRGQHTERRPPSGSFVPRIMHLRRIWANVVRAVAMDTPQAATQTDSIPRDAAEAARLQDMLASVALSEAVYRLVDHGAAAAISHVNEIFASMPTGLRSLQVQCSAETASHRYMVAEADDALYVTFVGTKKLRDVLADLAMWLAPMPASHETDTARAGESLLVHRGFLSRAKDIPVLELYRAALGRRKRLVFCGHSLGGAVAALCTLKLLSLDSATAARVSCITFACVALGNAEIAELVQSNGWSHLFHNFILPEDDVVRLALLVQLKGKAAIRREIATLLASPRSVRDDAAGNGGSDASDLHTQSSLQWLNRLSVDDLEGFLEGAGIDPEDGVDVVSPAAQKPPFAREPSSRDSSRRMAPPVLIPSFAALSSVGAQFTGPRGRSPNRFLASWRPLLAAGALSRARPRARSAPLALSGASYAPQGTAAPTPGALADAIQEGAAARWHGRAVAHSSARLHDDDSVAAAYAAADQVGPPVDILDGEAAASAVTVLGEGVPENEGVLTAAAGLQSTSPFEGAVAEPGEEEAVARSRPLLLHALQSLWTSVTSGAASLPMSLLPAYHPFGVQLYVNREGVTMGLHPDAPRPLLRRHSAPAAGPAAAVAAASRDDEALPAELGQDVHHEVADLVRREARGARRSAWGRVVHTHRMLTYRERITHVLRRLNLLTAPSLPDSMPKAVCAVLDECVVPWPEVHDAELRVTPRRVEGSSAGLVMSLWSHMRRKPKSGATGPPCLAELLLTGTALGLLASVHVEGPATASRAGQLVPTALPGEQCWRAEVSVPGDVVRATAAIPDGVAAVHLRTDFASGCVPARVTYSQCAVLGSSAAAVAAFMRLLQQQGERPAERASQDGEGGKQSSGSWSAWRPQRILQVLRARRPSADATWTPPDAGPALLCAGLRYVDAAWSPLAPRTSPDGTLRAVRGMLQLARSLERQAGPAALWRPPPWAVLFSSMRLRLWHVQAALGRSVRGLGSCSARAFQALASASQIHLMRLGMLRGQAQRLRTTVGRAKVTGPSVSRRAATGRTMMGMAPFASPGFGECERMQHAPSSTHGGQQLGAVSSQSSSPRSSSSSSSRRSLQSDGGRPGLASAPPSSWPVLAPRWPARQRRRASVSTASMPARLAPRRLLLPRGRAERKPPQADVSTAVLVEDLRDWRRTSCTHVMQSRRAAVARLMRACQAKGLTVTVLLLVPMASGGGVWEWLEELNAIKAAYGLPDECASPPMCKLLDVHASEKESTRIVAEVHNCAVDACLNKHQQQQAGFSMPLSKL